MLRSTFSGFEEAYLYNMSSLLAGSARRSQARGTSCIEQLSMLFRIRNPRRRLITAPRRKANLVFCYAETLWHLSGCCDLDFLEYYAPTMRRLYFTPDTGTSSAQSTELTGSAHGTRIFNAPHGTASQWDRIVAASREDPETKRAFLIIAQPGEDRSITNPDVACVLGLQFLLRAGRLHAIAYMRAVDAYLGSVSDVFCFTLLQELLAMQLNVRLGSYAHFMGSYHLYERDFERAASVLSGPRPRGTDDQMPAMPQCDNWPYVEKVIRLEEKLRNDRVALSADDIQRTGLPSYWKHVLVILELYRQTRYGLLVNARELLESLPRNYIRMMLNRYPPLRHFTASPEGRIS